MKLMSKEVFKYLLNKNREDAQATGIAKIVDLKVLKKYETNKMFVLGLD